MCLLLDELIRTNNYEVMKKVINAIGIGIELIDNTGTRRGKKRRRDGSETSATNVVDMKNIESIDWQWIEEIACKILSKVLAEGAKNTNGSAQIDWKDIVPKIIEQLKQRMEEVAKNDRKVSQIEKQTGVGGDEDAIVEIDALDSEPIKVPRGWIMTLKYLQGGGRNPLMILFGVLLLACLSVKKQFSDEKPIEKADEVNEMMDTDQ
jgi:hypothetical protein